MNIKIFMALLFVSLKSLGAILFSYILIELGGESVHTNIMHDISLIYAISIFSRLGAEQAILKYGGYFFEKGNIVYLKYLNSYLIFLSSILSIVFYLLLNTFYEFRNLDYLLGITWVIAANFLFITSSNLKVTKKPHLSSIFEAGTVLLFSSGFIYLFLKHSEITYIYYIVPLVTILMGICCIFILRPNINTNMLTPPWKYDSVVNKNVGDFKKSLPVYTLSSFFNFFSQWGVIFLVTVAFDEVYASSFILILRICAIYNVVMSLINSFDASKMYFIYKEHGQNELQAYINKYRKYYLGSGSFIFFSIWIFIVTISHLEFIDLISLDMGMFTLISFAFAFNLCTGPASHCLAMLGKEMQVMRSRIFFSTLLIIATYTATEKTYYFAFAFYIIFQKIYILALLKKHHGIKTFYFS